VTVTLPLIASLVAVIKAVPTATEETFPVVDTDATAGLLDDQATARLVTTFPLASCTVTVAWDVSPVCNVVAGMVTEIDATGAGVTVMVALAL
jgi:hypothetical protein